MKNKIQRYLAGEREGFSLVELIIVIAIMAILVGVVALAVLPNIAKSRESKDITALDSILSALNSAVASNEVSGSGSFDCTIGTVDGTSGVATINAAPSGVTDSADAAKVRAQVVKLLGKNTLALSSSKAKGASAIECSWSVAASGSDEVAIKVRLKDGSGTAVVGDYNTFEVKN